MNFRTLDLNLLRVFDTVMAEGSLTRAAEVLAVTQPAASHSLKRLHEAVGEPLFVRSAHGMKPTARAQALWPVVREWLAELQRALAPEDFDPQARETNFRIAMSDAPATELAPTLVRAIESRQARVNIRLVPLSSRDPRAMLRDGEADLAIGHFPEAIASVIADGPQSGLLHQRLYQSHYVCVMRRGHPLADALTLDAFCEAHHLLVSLSGRPHGMIDEALAALGRRRRIVLTVNQFSTAGRVVTQSDLITVLPLSFVAATGTEDLMLTRPLPPPVTLAPVGVQMIWPVRQDRDPAHRWLRALVQQAAGCEAA
ncbi:LysR family transcriptional regulator [Rubrivivax gelatinosus]|uniref:LysR family transcriptional regulator n=1 Tax=Rubrivivax gelatinosus TaxID=28068 RepID=A0ABS1DXX7_RUBGE|nr:LysR family transcriptional regulator [Rubrivivax gelatinosus]MBK1613442.1 LysR family transcriptional regulator [Rubrivivax gelatinosus]MBK1713986.1 LysR family transcriptional regulator [Rubrivivax gelatinosus]